MLKARAADRSVRLTISDGGQRAAGWALGRANGSVAAVEIGSGRVLALAGSGDGHPLHTLVPPGSTLSTVLAGAGLATRTITPRTRLDGDGDSDTRNVGGGRHGPTTVAEGLVLSSNTVFTDLAAPPRTRSHRAGAARRRVGEAGAKNVPGRATSVPTVSRLQDVDIEQRSTVLQLALLAAATGGDGGVPRARLIQTTPRTIVGRMWGARTNRILRAALRRVVTNGTGTPMRDPDLPIAAKTGTIPLRDGSTQASVIAFAPAARPRVAVAVSVKAPGAQTGGEAAGPIARRLLRALVR